MVIERLHVNDGEMTPVANYSFDSSNQKPCARAPQWWFQIQGLTCLNDAFNSKILLICESGLCQCKSIPILADNAKPSPDTPGIEAAQLRIRSGFGTTTPHGGQRWPEAAAKGSGSLGHRPGEPTSRMRPPLALSFSPSPSPPPLPLSPPLSWPQGERKGKGGSPRWGGGPEGKGRQGEGARPSGKKKNEGGRRWARGAAGKRPEMDRGRGRGGTGRAAERTGSER